MFTQFNPTTTSITIQNLPKVASALKNTMLNYQYASNCEWYGALKEAMSVKDIFDIFSIKFEMVNNTFVPAVKEFNPFPNIMKVLSAIAPYMSDGAIYANDEYGHYYTIKFENGVVSGKKKSMPTVDGLVSTNPEPPKKPEPKKTAKKQPKKEAKKFEFTAPTTTPVTMRRDDNTYTVQELVRELLKQMDAGNASKLVTIEADFLFQNEKYA